MISPKDDELPRAPLFPVRDALALPPAPPAPATIAIVLGKETEVAL